MDCTHNAADDCDCARYAAPQADARDAARYRTLRAGLLAEDWGMIGKLGRACPNPSSVAEFDAAIDAASQGGKA